MRIGRRRPRWVVANAGKIVIVKEDCGVPWTLGRGIAWRIDRRSVATASAARRIETDRFLLDLKGEVVFCRTPAGEYLLCH